VCPIEKYTEQTQQRKLKHRFYVERILSVTLKLSGTINFMTSYSPHFVCEVVCVCVCVCVCVKCSCWKYLCKIYQRDKFHVFKFSLSAIKQLIEESQYGYSCSWHAGNELRRESSDFRFSSAQRQGLFRDMLHFQPFQFTTFRIVIIPY